MTLSQAFEEFAGIVVNEQVATWEPKIAAAIPGLGGVLIREALALPPVQAEISKLELAGIKWFEVETAQAFVKAKAFILGHLSGRAQQLAQEALTAAQGVHLDVLDVHQLGLLVAAGKLREALQAAVEKYVLGQPISQPLAPEPATAS